MVLIRALTPIDQTLQLFGPPESVQGNIVTLRGARRERLGACSFKLPGAQGWLHASMLVVGGTARFTAHGDKGQRGES